MESRLIFLYHLKAFAPRGDGMLKGVRLLDSGSYGGVADRQIRLRNLRSGRQPSGCVSEKNLVRKLKGDRT